MLRDNSHFALNASRSRTVSGVFTEFLDKEINIAAGTRERASGSQNALREFLRGVASDDKAFPRILRYEDVDFLGGSFARHTKIWPLDDIDVYFPIDGTGLFYYQGGQLVSCNVLNDAVLTENPLMLDYDRWWDGRHLSSKKLINGFATALTVSQPRCGKITHRQHACGVVVKRL